MKTKEWIVLGFLFQLLASFLIMQDMGYEQACGYMHLQMYEPLENVGDLECVINAEMYEPAIYTVAGIWLICWIMAFFTWFENRSGQKSDKKRKLVDLLIETSHADEKDYILKTAEKIGLKEIPHDFQELIFYAKKIGKEKEAEKALHNWSEKQAKYFVEEAPKKLRKWEKL